MEAKEPDGAVTAEQLYKAFIAGFCCSAEGYNGEYVGKQSWEETERELRESFERWLKEERP